MFVSVQAADFRSYNFSMKYKIAEGDFIGGRIGSCSFWCIVSGTWPKVVLSKTNATTFGHYYHKGQWMMTFIGAGYIAGLMLV